MRKTFKYGVGWGDEEKMFEGDRHRKKNERMRVQNLIQFKQRERRKRCDELNRESDFKLTEK